MLRPRPARWLLAAILCLAVAPATFAQGAWPTKTVRIMVPFAPGALTDVAARAIAQELSQQPAAAVRGRESRRRRRNGRHRRGRQGGAGRAHARIHRQLVHDLRRPVFPKLAYDPLKDLVPVTLAVEAPAIMVARPGLPACRCATW